MSICSRKFLSMSVQLSLQACNIIKQFSQDKNMKKFFKGDDDHVTEADYKVQSMLIKGFKMHFPELKIIGEETKQFEGNIDFNYQKLSPSFLPEQVLINSSSKVNECCLWIDPIDCTKGFIEGTLQDVTVLVGMSVNGQPQLGLVGIPFKKEGEKRIFEPQILFGSVADSRAYKYRNQEWKQLKIRSPLSQMTVATSISRSNSAQQRFIKHFRAKNILAGGSGRKIALVIKGQADIMAYVGSATCKWDSCAGEAIVKAMGGKFSTPTGNSISYNPEQSISNDEGIFCSLNHDVHKKSIDFMNGIKNEL